MRIGLKIKMALVARLASYGLILVSPTLANAAVNSRQVAPPVSQNQSGHHPSSQSHTTVIYEGLGSVSTKKYFDQLDLPHHSIIEESLSLPEGFDQLYPELQFDFGLKKLLTKKDALAPVNRFPLSTALRAANPVALEHDDISKPFFFVGLDSNSLSWLDRHQQSLVRMDAQGFVVAGQNYSDYESLRKHADEIGLSLAVLPADHFANAIGVETYPAVVVPVTSSSPDYSQTDAQQD
jgi:integrating conjugative element protein (TIGR03765 family)